jgi:hypothetical protein
MNTPQRFPDDANGRVLKRMLDTGDDLTQSRIIDFAYVFSDRQHAISFVQAVDDSSIELCIAWYADKSVWEVLVRRDMVPEHASISSLEVALETLAKRSGGRSDGWGCIAVKSR